MGMIPTCHACMWKGEQGLQEVVFFLSPGRPHGFNSSSQTLWQPSSLMYSVCLLDQLPLVLEGCSSLSGQKKFMKCLHFLPGLGESIMTAFHSHFYNQPSSQYLLWGIETEANIEVHVYLFLIDPSYSVW